MDKIDELLTRGVEQIIPTREELGKVLRSGKKLRVYQGFDPTSPDLHIGHLVGLRKLRQWQDLGHEVIFLIGNFTALVGDPTGKDKTRPMIPEEQVKKNAQTYKKQVSKVLRFEGENAVQIKYNGDWLAKLSAVEIARLASYLTVPQMMERDMFQKRFAAGADVALSEFFYPFMQGYDSVEMDVDVEVGGNDQLFNMMIGRDLMHRIKQKNKFVMTTPLIVDSTGKKIGKSEGNAISLIKPPGEMFGMIMQLDDSVIAKCFECITTVPMEKVAKVGERLKSGENPMILKKELALQIVSELHNQGAAQKAQEEFEKTFQKEDLATADIPPSPSPEAPTDSESLVATYGSVSLSEAKRLLDQKAVELNGKILGRDKNIEIKPSDILKIGKKKFVKFT